MRFWLVLGLMLVGQFVMALLAEPERYTIVAGCTVQTEQTGNNQPTIVYYTCDNWAAFMVHSESPGAQHLARLLGKTVDIKIEVLPR